MNLFTKDKVILELSEKDFSNMLLLLGLGVGVVCDMHPENRKWTFELMNRINEGNPRWIQYSMAEIDKLEKSINKGEIFG